MLTTNEALTPSDLIRPLSLEALNYFASGAIPLSDNDKNCAIGKFVRVGGLMIIGTTIDYGEPDYRGRRNSLFHRELLGYIKEHPELEELKGNLTDLTTRGIISDAGSTIIRHDQDLSPTALGIGGYSVDFGEADPAGRQRTIEIAQKLVGDTVTVRAL